MSKLITPPLAVGLVGGAIAGLVFVYRALSRAEKKLLKVATWNIAAVNNNPFEYWMTHPSPDYDVLMQGVESFIESPGARDVLVGEVFTADMWQALKTSLQALGCSGVEQTEERWRTDISQRRIISGFMKDKGLGDKRLASMPDRVTNTISTADGGVANRPTPISCCQDDMGSVATWWPAWQAFMFERPVSVLGKDGTATRKTPAAMLGKIKRAKYPALTEEEEAISIPLQALCMAVFDAILVHIVNSVSAGGAWQRLKSEIIGALYATKDSRIVNILQTTYAEQDVFFLQEAATAFGPKLQASSIGREYTVVSPVDPSTSDQNSIMLLRTSAFDASSVVDCTAEVVAHLGEASVPVASGDLLVITVTATDGTAYSDVHGNRTCDSPCGYVETCLVLPLLLLPAT